MCYNELETTALHGVLESRHTKKNSLRVHARGASVHLAKTRPAEKSTGNTADSQKAAMERTAHTAGGTTSGRRDLAPPNNDPQFMRSGVSPPAP
jgi:hypothetical protein